MRSRPAPLAVVKIGGSVFERRADLDRLVGALAGRSVILLAGGGRLADAVRVAQTDLGFSDALAHRLAIDAMARSAEILENLYPDCRAVSAAEAALRMIRRGLTPVWGGLGCFLDRPEIAAGWSVTSDSLGAVLARDVAATDLILVKSAEPPAGADFAALGRAGYVDADFALHASAFSGTVRFVGPADYDRLSAFLPAGDLAA
ncbi:hypothetical protein [Methylobrevis pamukkalensis]|uniref:Amino acid kinase family protein n=1 Tax=Methylobrevis pamukkalensis TaxID=1439726 RepID=A0A1E3H4W7_9HYPH|nr:hypothetical protein [Methylobrevis pamukkalensis]ODN71350.1 Amino acid kinase family protein [Methylobrevis pamukkalensis]